MFVAFKYFEMVSFLHRLVSMRELRMYFRLILLIDRKIDSLSVWLIQHTIIGVLSNLMIRVHGVVLVDEKGRSA